MRVSFMNNKATTNHNGNTNPYVMQAGLRELYWPDFRDEMKLIGARLHRLRILQDLSLDIAANALKIPKRRLYHIERGTYIHLDLPYLYKLSAYYGTTPLDVLSVIPDTSFADLKY